VHTQHDLVGNSTDLLSVPQSIFANPGLPGWSKGCVQPLAE